MATLTLITEVMALAHSYRMANWSDGPEYRALEAKVRELQKDAARWISVDERHRLPDIGVPVFGCTRTGAIAVFARDDGGGVGGWLWAMQGWHWNLADPQGIEADDDYDVLWWRPMFELPIDTALAAQKPEASNGR